MRSPSIFLALPNRGTLDQGTAMSTHKTGYSSGVVIKPIDGSLLTFNFNKLWTMALNMRQEHNLTHFAMLHDDILPLDDGWLKTLVEEQQATGADVLSTVSAIKDERGIVSTAFYNPRTNRMRRLTMTDVMKLPETFDASYFSIPGCVVLPNTGLWVCDFTKPWVEKICFTIRDCNFQTASGEWVTQCLSEDWHFGIQCQKLGVSVKATRTVRSMHIGKFAYPNFTEWGSWETEKGWQQLEQGLESDTIPMIKPLYEPADV